MSKPLSSLSTMTRSRQYLELQGALVDCVECVTRYVKRDLFGFGDLIAFHRDGTVEIVQTTSYSEMNRRIKKIRANDNARRLISRGHTITVHGWKDDESAPHFERVIFR